MRKRVYVETTIVSYLTAWPSRDIVIAGHQQITHDWWDNCRENFELCVSELVLSEAAGGDTDAANKRLNILRPMLILETSVEALALAEALLHAGALPEKAAADALHIAIAASKAIPFLLTWNCRHLANATMRPVIESVCINKALKPPIICTPEELMENWP